MKTITISVVAMVTIFVLGGLVGDMVRFERGMRTLEEILSFTAAADLSRPIARSERATGVLDCGISKKFPANPSTEGRGCDVNRWAAG